MRADLSESVLEFEFHLYAQKRCDLIPNRSYSKTIFKVEPSEMEPFEYALFFWEQREEKHSKTDSFNLSFKKSSSKDMRMDKYGVMETPKLSF